MQRLVVVVVLVTTLCKASSCRKWDPSFLTRVEPRPPALAMWNLTNGPLLVFFTDPGPGGPEL